VSDHPLETWDSAARPPRAAEEWSELWRHRSLVGALVARNVKVRYKRSLLGIAWSMLAPAGMMIVLSLVFSRVFRDAAPGYPAFLFPALLLWTFFAQTTSAVAAEAASGADLWRRVRLPKTAPAIATVLTGLVNLGCALVPLFALLALMRRPVGPALLSLPVVVLGAGAFALGVALAVSAAALHFADVADAFGIVVLAWMYATPVLYPLSVLPERVRAIVVLNPMTLYVEAFRAPFYLNAVASPETLAASLVVGAATLVAGWLLFTAAADGAAHRG
jgi:ABC-type polysaccharide/polyol phosphate export permease